MTDYAETVLKSSYVENTPRPGSVDGAVDDVDKALANLIDAIGDLEGEFVLLTDRLSPVLRDQEIRPTPETGARIAAVAPCALAGMILDRAERIADIANTIRTDARRVQDVRERLEV